MDWLGLNLDALFTRMLIKADMDIQLISSDLDHCGDLSWA